MMDWARASERHLVNQLYKMWQEGGSSNQAYAELNQRLERYFEKKVTERGWQILKQHQEEILSHTIWRLIANHMTFRGNSRHFRKFIRTTLLNVCADILRKELREADSLDEDIYLSESGNVTEGVDRFELFTISDISVEWDERYDTFRRQLPEITLLNKESHQETQKLLRIVLASLDDDCANLIYLEYIQGKPQHEIALEMGITHSYVRKRLSDCREKLRRLFFETILHYQAENQSLDFPSAFLQLPQNERIVIQAWWNGKTRWNSLGQLFTPPLSQAETKLLFARGLERLFSIISHNQGANMFS